MRPLQNILDISQFTLMTEKKDSHSSSIAREDCMYQVKTWILQDKTTTNDNLREKVDNYLRNYFAAIPTITPAQKEELVEEIADDIEKDLKQFDFDTRPLASVTAQVDRNKILEDPEEKYIKLR